MKTHRTQSLVNFVGIMFIAFGGGASAQPSPFPPGDSIQTMEVNGVKRIFRLRVPASYDGASAWPLVFCLHGRGGNGMGMENGTGWGVKADQEKFIAVFPNGLGQPQIWNGGLSELQMSGGEDVEFIRQLMDKLEGSLNIDRHRVYCCGMSSGAIMTGRAGAELSDRFAALGIAAGTVGATQPNGSEKEIAHPASPISVILFHGRKDGTVRFNGGGPLLNAFSVSRSIAFWTKADGCSEPPQHRQLGPNTTVDDYHGKNDTEVVLYTFANGGHVWPNMQNDGMSATDKMWEFFVQHPKT
jgi:polyhydroxybutyrate depolymerase